jgi:hypothetical protein
MGFLLRIYEAYSRNPDVKPLLVTNVLISL